MGSIVGNATATWFKKTKFGLWFYKKVEQCYNWAAERYDIDILTKEEKLIKKFPMLSKKIDTRFDIDLSKYPNINSIYERCLTNDAFIKALPKNQPDAE